MNLRACAFFASCVLALSGCSDSNSNSPPPEPEPSALELELRQAVDDAEDAGFSGAVRVSVGGDVLVSEGRGLADRERGIPNGEHTAFDVGSVLKTFTAVAIFRLVEDGALELSDTLGDLLPDVPEDKSAITLRQLIQHSAGFDEYHDTEGDFEAMTRLEARERILSQELLFPPGEDEAYSNSGYTLLADIIETVSGESYTSFVHRELFAPAGMRESGFYSEPLWQNVKTAIGYDASTFGANDPASWPYTWALVGNGGLVTTVVDLDAWTSAFWSGAVVEPETLALIKDEYLGGEDADRDADPIYGEAGAGDFGFGSAVIYAPVPNVRVFVTTNTWDDFDVEDFAVELAETALAAN